MEALELLSTLMYLQKWDTDHGSFTSNAAEYDLYTSSFSPQLS